MKIFSTNKSKSRITLIAW